jgi:hypothetical protein
MDSARPASRTSPTSPRRGLLRPAGRGRRFFFKYGQETLGMLHVKGGRVVRSSLIHGDYGLIEEHNRRLREDPMIGALGEWASARRCCRSQGATSRTRRSSAPSTSRRGATTTWAATHARPFQDPPQRQPRRRPLRPPQDPEIRIPEVRMHRDGKTTVVMGNYRPGDYMIGLLAGE